MTLTPRSDHLSQMRLRIDPSGDKFLEYCLARLKTGVRQIASKKFVSKPNPIRVHDVAFTIIRDLAQTLPENIGLPPPR